jgi:hypothetical protein
MLQSRTSNQNTDQGAALDHAEVIESAGQDAG